LVFEGLGGSAALSPTACQVSIGVAGQAMIVARRRLNTVTKARKAAALAVSE
jgi:hypothetical protein